MYAIFDANYIYIYIYISWIELVTVVEGDPKTPFSIATTPRCRGRYFLLWIAPFYPWYVPYNAMCWGAIFESLLWLDLGLNHSLSGQWRTHYPLGQRAGLTTVTNFTLVHWYNLRVFANGPGDQGQFQVETY